MVRNYSIKELSHRVTRALFKWLLLSPQSVKFRSAQHSLNSKQLPVCLCTTATFFLTSRVYESSCGCLGIIIQNFHRIKYCAGPKWLQYRDIIAGCCQSNRLTFNKGMISRAHQDSTNNSCLISVLLTGPNLLVANFYEKFFPLVYVPFFTAWQQSRKDVQQYLLVILKLVYVIN